ncbi:MAG: hypothetical protein KKC76_02770 [Proteobacteria bacterium]|nr:hypothetical protein [Pseudomonadota bacterium]MBU4295651.1 hypothetical protein [Pseudomonadota bacterium]MCG2746842.1 hypothetical protein [Desulfobulbaceae bacterium]
MIFEVVDLSRQGVDNHHIFAADAELFEKIGGHDHTIEPVRPVRDRQFKG